MFWRMVWRTLIRQRGKMFMIAITIALGVSLSTAMMNVMLGVGDKVNKELKVYGANITVRHKDATLLNELYGLDSTSGLAEKYLEEVDVFNIKTIFWGFNIVDFAPFLEKTVQVDGTDRSVSVLGTWTQITANLPTGETVDTGMRPLRNWWERDIRGEWLTQGETDKVMVGSLYAGRNNLSIGDKIRLRYGQNVKEFTVKMIFTDGGDTDEKIIMDLAALQALTDTIGKISYMEVSALTTPDNELARRAAQDPKSLRPDEYEVWYCTAYVSAICHQIQEVVRNAVASPVRQVAESEGEILNKVSLLMTLITILSSIGSALAISNLITASVIERRQEVGLMKAIGAQSLPIIMLVLVEVLITGFIGAALGYGAGIGFAQIIGVSVFGSTIEPVTLIIPVIGVLLTLVILLGSIPAIRYLLNLKPTEVLHGK